MGKSSPSPPPAPDPVATAAAQSQYNKEGAQWNAQLNRINTTTPYGNDTYNYTADPTGATPGNWNRSITLAPEQQKALDASNQITDKANELALDQFGRVSSTLGKEWDPWSHIPGQVSGINVTPGQIQSSISPSGPIQSTLGKAGPIQDKIQDSGPLQLALAAGKVPLQAGLDFSKVPGLVGGDALKAQGDQVSGAIYDQAKLNLDPRYQQEETQVANNLVNRGIPPGSAAYNTAMSNFRQSRDNAYQTAQDSATQGGVAAANTLFGQGLAARQQGIGETTMQGQFANQAQGQEFGENATAMTLANAAQGQQFGQNATGMQLANEAQAQEFGQGATAMQLANAAQAQNFGQNATGMQLANTAQGQEFGQNFSLAQQNAALKNQAHQTGYAEALQARELPLQETQSLMGTGSVQQPNFGTTPLVNYNAPDYQGIVQSNYGQQSQNWANQSQQDASAMGGLFGGLGSLGGGILGLAGKSNLPSWLSFMSAAPIAASDRRLKDYIRKVGTADNGLTIYAFRYRDGGPTLLGFMADEVEGVHPEAVFEVGGIKLVDYDRAIL